MFILGIGTATPLHCYRQSQGWEALQSAPQFSQLNVRSRAILKKVLLGNNGISTRYLALNSLSEAFEIHPDALHARFAKNAPLLGANAAERALHTAGLQSAELDAIVVSTCTGYLCPGLTSYMSERLGLRPDILALDLVGQGCGAALPNLQMADALLASGRCRYVLSICVEICSAAFYLDDDPGVLISACLFGDGAGAVVLSNKPNRDRRRLEWKAAGTILSPADRDYLRFEQKNGMLRNILTQQVPSLAGKYAELVFKEALLKANVRREEVTAWIMHAGGREILEALRARLGLEEADLQWSADILRRFGNVSSPCVIFVLEAALAGQARGGHWWMSAFGAGFNCHGALLEAD
ncbi:MAG: stilbene synthase [Verrucomicrobia bacterium]|nr:stilbene synthase [Verrucomicrobiota bacterium]